VNDPRKTTRILVTPDRDGERIDIFLAATTDLSRRAARRWIADGLVMRNSSVVRVQSKPLSFGDVIDVLKPQSEVATNPAQPPPEPEVLYEDRWLLVASKPAGVLSQSAEGRRPGDALPFDQQVLLSLAWREGRKPFLRMFHRIDRMTSGAVLFARSSEILPVLTRAWSDGSVERLYVAVIEGHPESEEFVVDLPIARDQDHRWRFMCSEGGKPARTGIQVLTGLDNGLSVVSCRLDTGRTHQVRVHLSAVGHPVVGDRLYGSTRGDRTGRPLLHAASLALPHPSTGDHLRIDCPAPADLASFLPDGPNLSAS
jgi:23S rRNA pseudouridine1911/1915/1917 synthase